MTQQRFRWQHKPQGINRTFGRQLRSFLNHPRTFAILDRLNPSDAQLESWHSGGCRLLACALIANITHRKYPGTCTLKVISTSESPIDHVVLHVATPLHGIWYLDADGATREQTLLNRFAKRESRTNPRLVSYNEAVLDLYEIQCPPLKLARLIQLLNERMPLLK